MGHLKNILNSKNLQNFDHARMLNHDVMAVNEQKSRGRGLESHDFSESQRLERTKTSGRTGVWSSGMPRRNTPGATRNGFMN